MVSVTVEVVSVFEVIEPCVKLGTSGTDIAVCTFARALTTATRASFSFMFMIISHSYWTVSSVTNWPVPTVPAPPAVTVITPAVVIVPAKSPAEPAAVDT